MYPKNKEYWNKFFDTNMNVQQGAYCGILSRVRPLYWFCKMAGLVPFYYTVNSATKVEIIDANVSSNVLCFIWSVVVFSVILAGFIYYVTILFSVSTNSPGEITSFLVSMPLSISLSLMEIFMNQTVNRKNICYLVNKLNDIEKSAVKYQNSRVLNTNMCSNTKLLVLLGVITLYLCLDAWLWRDRMGLIGEATLRMSHLVQFLVIIQFCKLTQFLRHSLKVLNRVLSESVDDTFQKCNMYTTDFPKSSNCAVICMNFLKLTGHMAIPNRVRPAEESVFDRIVHNTRKNDVFLFEMRRIYRQIYDCVGYVNSVYGLPILLEFIRNTTAIISYILHLIAVARGEISSKNRYAFPIEIFVFLSIVWVVIFVFRYVAITVLCHMATSEAHRIQDNVQYLLLRQNVRNEVLEQLKLFSCQLTVNKIHFTAFGFFSVNLKTLSTFVASVLTYIIVFEQMKN
jgi:hypothetical protein